MREKVKKRKLSIPELKFNATHPKLAKVQAILNHSNYLSDPYEPKRLDTPTQDALKKYQVFHSLAQTGTTDTKTVATFKQLKCSTPNPKLLEGFRRRNNNFFILENVITDLRISPICHFRGVSELTYTIETDPALLPLDPNRDLDMAPDATLNFTDIQKAIDAAFATWGALLKSVKLKPAPVASNATFKLKWVTRAHHDPYQFDGRNGFLAHAFYPKKCAEGFPGQCHFDREENWGFNESSRIIDIETVALHEIGHLLGLTHSNIETSVMHESHYGERRKFPPGDPAIEAIRKIYD